jgi:GNAT superfamily N-acetyltransferase
VRPVLVLTATIEPRHQSYVVIADPYERYLHYQRAVRRWVARHDLFSDIVFCESSGHPLCQRLEGEFGDRVRVVALTDLPDYPAHLGKGYGEALILERLAASAGITAPHVVKCTGRLYVRNARQLLAGLDEGVDMLVRLRRDLRFADSRFFVCRTALLTDLAADLTALIDDSAHVYMEHALARCALRYRGGGARIESFPVPPLLAGRSASTNRRYDSLSALGQWLRDLVLCTTRYF